MSILPGGAAVQYPSSAIFVIKRKKPVAIEVIKTHKWGVVFDCERLGNHEELRANLYSWAYNQNIKIYVPWYINHAHLTSYDDAVLCMLSFS